MQAVDQDDLVVPDAHGCDIEGALTGFEVVEGDAHLLPGDELLQGGR